jgi:transcriptional regulator with XRE-family HTH domain
MAMDYGTCHMAFAMNNSYRNGNIHWMDNLTTPGKRIRALRVAKKLTQETVAGLAKIDQSTISDIENDKGLSAEYLMRLCDVLASEPQYIMRGTSSMEDVLQKLKVLMSAAQNENFPLADVSTQGKPDVIPAGKARNLKAVKAVAAPRLSPEVQRKLLSGREVKDERSTAKGKKKPRSGKTS